MEFKRDNVIELNPNNKLTIKTPQQSLESMLSSVRWRVEQGKVAALAIAYIDIDGNILSGTEGDDDYNTALMGALLSLALSVKG